jgi:hypothetical protein
MAARRRVMTDTSGDVKEPQTILYISFNDKIEIQCKTQDI